MNKSIVLFVLFSLLFSCAKKENTNLKHSIGKINTIAIVIDDQLWKGIIGDSIRSKFSSPVKGMSKEQPQFDINQYPLAVLEGYVSRNRILIIATIDDIDSFSIVKNQYAKNQYVFHVSGTTNAALIKNFEKNSSKIIDIIKKEELNAHKQLLKDSLVISNPIKEQFQILLGVPKGYVSFVEKDKFIWYKSEIVSGSKSIVVTQLPYNRINKNKAILEQLIKIKDSIGEQNIKKKETNVGVYTDITYPLLLTELVVDGKFSYEVRGRWRLKDSFMYGPFINYYIWDENQNRIIYLEGFCYLPNSEKRDIIHELETILNGVKLKFN